VKMVNLNPRRARYSESKIFFERSRGHDWRAVGKRIRQLRGFELTQVEFARRIGVSQSYLSAVEHGQNEVGAQVLLAISREFGKSIEWLLTGKP
jgi:DNA-binding XRE family transcriptional regulator